MKERKNEEKNGLHIKQDAESRTHALLLFFGIPTSMHMTTVAQLIGFWLVKSD